MGRKRKDGRFPPYCYNDGSRWIYRPYKNGKLLTPVRLCAADAPVSKLWEQYEKHVGHDERTISWLMDQTARPSGSSLPARWRGIGTIGAQLLVETSEMAACSAMPSWSL